MQHLHTRLHNNKNHDFFFLLNWVRFRLKLKTFGQTEISDNTGTCEGTANSVWTQSAVLWPKKYKPKPPMTFSRLIWWVWWVCSNLYIPFVSHPRYKWSLLVRKAELKRDLLRTEKKHFQHYTKKQNRKSCVYLEPHLCCQPLYCSKPKRQPNIIVLFHSNLHISSKSMTIPMAH